MNRPRTSKGTERRYVHIQGPYIKEKEREKKGEGSQKIKEGKPEGREGQREEENEMVERGVIQGGKLNHDMMSMDMGNGKTMKHDDPNSVLLEPGQSKEVVWKFTEKGDIEFACNVPGHYQAGMYGDVNFE